MTTVKIKTQQNSIVQIECIGHVGYKKNGDDIVCAALSTIVQTALLGLEKVAKVKYEYTKNDKEGYLKAKLIDNLDATERHDCDLILDTMLEGIKDMQDGYPKFIKLEVE